MIMAGPHHLVVLSFHSRGGFKKYLYHLKATFFTTPHFDSAYAVRRLMQQRSTFSCKCSLMQMRALARPSAMLQVVPSVFVQGMMSCALHN
jgi:hypothetical protein